MTGPGEEEVFSYRVNAAGVVSIRHHGRPVTTLRGKAAARFLTRVEAADAAGAQLEMARATGNFRRGNERVGKAREGGRSG